MTAARPSASSGPDLGIGVGHGEHDRVLGHPTEVDAREQPGPGHADEHVGAGDHVAQRALAAIPVRVLGEPLLGDVEVVAALPDGALAVDADDLGHAGLEQDLAAGHAGGADPGDDDPERAHRLVDDAQRVLERGQRHHGGAVLVVVEHRDVEQLLEPVLDLEARRARRCPRG